METTNVYHFALLVGMGIAIGFCGMIGLVVSLSKFFDWFVSKTYRKCKVAKWVFGETYNHYQYLSINGVKWQVLPTPNPSTLLLAHHSNKPRQRENKHIIIDCFEGKDLGEELNKLTEDKRQTETHVAATV